MATQKELLQFKHFKPKSACWTLTFSSDSRLLAVAGHTSDRTPEIVFLDVPSGKETLKMLAAKLSKKHSSGVHALLFSPDGKRLFTSDSAGKIFVWQWETGRLVKEWQADPLGMSLSADGKVLLTRGAFAALIWDLDALLEHD